MSDTAFGKTTGTSFLKVKRVFRAALQASCHLSIKTLKRHARLISSSSTPNIYNNCRCSAWSLNYSKHNEVQTWQKMATFEIFCIPERAALCFELLLTLFCTHLLRPLLSITAFSELQERSQPKKLRCDFYPIRSLLSPYMISMFHKCAKTPMFHLGVLSRLACLV